MNPRITKAEAALLMLFPGNSELSPARRARMEAIQTRDAAVAQGVRGFFARLTAALADWRDRQRTLAELNALSDRELADIGLTRGEIPALLRQPAPAPVAAVATAAPRAVPAAANDRAAARVAA